MMLDDALDRWVAVGTTSGLAAESVQRGRIGDHDLVVWRGRDGQVHAWQNRCPHRGMRLSFGFVRGDRLTCLYHGWTYDGEGACVAIPAHPNLVPPRTIAAAQYSSIDHAGLIWVAPGDRPPAPPTIAGDWQACRSIKIDAPHDRVAALLAAAPGSTWVMPDVARIGVPLDGGTRSLLCAVQPVHDRETMLHIAIEGTAVSPRLRRLGSELAKRWRREIELADTRAAEAADV